MWLCTSCKPHKKFCAVKIAAEKKKHRYERNYGTFHEVLLTQNKKK